ncbi:hypothetical protein key_096 [Erwinia phage KEY]|uniref:Uncharacterized protein n=2 Tax=Keyvirus TaxID=3152642 RepID=A0AAE7WBQ1_9CAUD|nr:hypothetical protein AAS21_gp100 [Pantoea phage vB_PagS_AAS21]QYC51587.1 hypothetical protein key_096 [Erwinia phage KEY]
MNELFFFHTLVEYALFQKYDVETDLGEFVRNDPILSKETYATTANGETLTFLDILDLSNGKITSTSKNFFRSILENIPELLSQPDETLMLTSMHSGSSTHLTLGEVRYIANYELSNAE